MHAPADRPVDGRGRLDDLDLVARREVLAAQLLGQGEAVEPLVGDLVGGPGGNVADLLRLVGRLQERFRHSGQALDGGRRLLQLLAALDDLGSHHGCRLPSLVARF